MRPLCIVTTLILALYCCSAMNLLPGNEPTINEFPDELVLYCLTFLPASVIASTATVSQRFSNLSRSLLCSLFGNKQADGSYELDPCRIYSYYHEMESSPSVKALTIQSLDWKRTTSLSCESFRNNEIIEYFCRFLFDSKNLVNIREWDSKGMELGLNALIIKYRLAPLRVCVTHPSESLINTVGVDPIRSIMQSVSTPRLLDHPDFKNKPSARKTLYRLFYPKLSKSLKILLDTNDVFDSRLDSQEFKALELILLSDLVVDEKSIQRSLDLADRFIRTSLCFELASAIECIGNTAFLISILKIRELTPGDQFMLYLFLYMRADAMEIFCAINDLGAIQASIREADDTVDPLKKFIYGIVTGMDDNILIALSGALNEGFEIARNIAAYHKKSPSVLLTLMSSEELIDCYGPRNLLNPFSAEYAMLDYDLADNIKLLDGEITTAYWNFVSIPRRLEYFEHMLKHANDDDIVCAMDALNQCAGLICTDKTYRLFIKRCITSGAKDIYGGILPDSYLQKEINGEIGSLFKSGVDFSMSFELDPNQPFFLGTFQVRIYNEILSWENGVDLVLGCLHSANEEDSSVSYTIKLIVICLYNNIGFDMPTTWSPLILDAICCIVEHSDVTWRLRATFEACKSIPAPSSFHAALAETISSQEYFELLDTHYLPRGSFEV